MVIYRNKNPSILPLISPVEDMDSLCEEKYLYSRHGPTRLKLVDWARIIQSTIKPIQDKREF